ncbi:flavohemoglobin expression-modulating QEGLA motif protein [Rubrivirga sp.]|uniref:flavohemoglobin expression-modulating QEGLA motif protein n=1 Tax=Rubrivirga sp. TaxID=1885344 RepID=UPI003B5300EB
MTAEALGRTVRDGLDAGTPTRLDLDGGTVFVDHAVPVLAVHRCPGGATGDPALDARAACDQAHQLVTTQPAYVVASDPDPEAARASVRAVADVLAEACGALVVVEVWSPLDEGPDDTADPFDRAPGFTIFTAPDGPSDDAVDALCDALSGIEVAGQGAGVEHVVTPTVAPPGLPPLGLPGTVGLAVDAVFHNARDDEFYPRVLARLRRTMAPALRQAAADATGAPAPTLARTTLEPAARDVDRGLAAVAQSFGFLLQVTPVNGDAAWDEFRGGDCERAPELLYRPLTFDPDRARRALFALPLEDVEDPVVEGLLRECRDEIESHIRMVLDVETPQFLPESLRVYGAPDDALVGLARQIVAALDTKAAAASGAEVVGATAFAARARAQLEAYRAQSEHVPVEVDVRDDLPGTLMVSRGQLLIGSRYQVAARRVEALLAHEVGTHVLTYANGRAQPLEQLHHGLAGYQDLQEGLAVFAEWLVGGLTRGRFRTLAARVLGARALADGADFVETFRLLRADAGLSDRRAFRVAVRLYRGGGLTKDMVYLRGLRDLLRHLADGGPFWPLFVGKMALRHLPAITDLRERGVLVAPPLRPLHADDPDVRARLDRARDGLSVTDLVRDAG